jgi:hypothetical protein
MLEEAKKQKKSDEEGQRRKTAEREHRVAQSLPRAVQVLQWLVHGLRVAVRVRDDS